MLAIPVSSHFDDNKQVVPADGYVLSIFDDAVFMYCDKDWTIAFFETDIKKEDIEVGTEYTYYYINEKIYKTSFTESHTKLEKKIQLKERFTQCSLF